MADWFPEAIRDPGNNSGDYTDTGEPKGLLHTTEGKTYAGARQAYVLNNSWPHATCTYEDGRFVIYQHNPLSKPSRALKNTSAPGQTNRDNVIQLEIVGTANRHNAASWGPQYVENFPTPYLDGIARWMRFVNENHRVPNRSTVTWKRYPESYGTTNGIRLSATQWDAYSGWLGHQHAAENDHGDPGLIAIDYLLSQAGSTPQEEDMDAEEHNWLRVLDFGTNNGGTTPYSERGELTDRIRAVDSKTSNLTTAVAELAAQNAAILEAISQLSGGSTVVDYALVQNAAEAAVREVLGSVDETS